MALRQRGLSHSESGVSVAMVCGSISVLSSNGTPGDITRRPQAMPISVSVPPRFQWTMSVIAASSVALLFVSGTMGVGQPRLGPVPLLL